MQHVCKICWRKDTVSGAPPPFSSLNINPFSIALMVEITHFLPDTVVIAKMAAI